VIGGTRASLAGTLAGLLTTTLAFANDAGIDLETAYVGRMQEALARGRAQGDLPVLSDRPGASDQ
jgi:hypothetical protein